MWSNSYNNLRVINKMTYVYEIWMPLVATKSKYGKISKSNILIPTPGACDVSEVCKTLK